ncbi:hypothetical protein HJC23_004839 [Cyclotella cryptica]|uniref:SMP-LTD domain-containing protein n=1 Tax=Cyclotella cryptica TaxID=29204 RepID=A0ABD3P5H5_9STRA|eukprot:CCRYP_018294-RA/>CCRYP_018294-RA protein AED:0.01 eAED:0.00 QI:0/-1/0/1/-1/1/1/0/514
MNSADNTAPKYFAFWSTFPTLNPILSHSLIWIIVLLLSATRSLPFCQDVVNLFLSTLSLFLLRFTFILTATLSFLHQTGALRRFALQFAETELSKVLNRTLVTISDIRVDLWRGKVVVQDLVIHNKDRELWEWESPCLARVGRIEATLNFTSVIDVPFYGPILNHTFKDIYTGLVEDVQVFVEKRRNIFNFHVLDGDLDIPDPKLVMEDYKRRKGLLRDDGSAASHDGAGDDSDSFLTLSQSMSLNTDEDRLDSSIARDAGSQSREKLDEATLIVEKLVGAVSNLGRAATDGGSKALHSALRNQKDSLVKSMKMLHSSTVNGDEPSSSKPKKDKVVEGVNVIRQLGKVVEQNVTDIKDQMSFLQKPPKRKEGLVEKHMDIVRIGSFLLREMRIFTKDVLITKTKTTGTSKANVQIQPENIGAASIASTQAGWSRPIVIWELAITGAEFSPPMSARDSHTGLPVVGIPVDRAVDIILKRLMTEAAKSNTGKLLETAFGDVFSVMNISARKEVTSK